MSVKSIAIDEPHLPATIPLKVDISRKARLYCSRWRLVSLRFSMYRSSIYCFSSKEVYHDQKPNIAGAMVRECEVIQKDVNVWGIVNKRRSELYKSLQLLRH